VLSTVGIIRLAHKAFKIFKIFYYPDLDLTHFVEQRTFLECDQVLMSCPCGVELGSPNRIFEVLDPPRLQGLPSPLVYWVSLRSSWTKYSLVKRPISLTLEHAKSWDVEVSNAEWVMHFNSVCFWLSDHAVRCCSHLARSSEVFHNWVGKTCGTIYDRSRDALSKSGIWPESRLSIGVGYTIRVVSSDQSRVFRLESGMRPE
jgi:hypothetical protein